MKFTWHGRGATFRDARTTIGVRATRVTAIVAALVIVVTATILVQSPPSAFAADCPSWAEVQAARNSVAAKQAQIARLDGLLAGLQSVVTASQTLPEQIPGGAAEVR